MKETDISRPKVSFLPPRAAQLRVGPVPNINCPDKRASPYLALFLQGNKFNLAAIPPHLCREESRQKCSGQAGGKPFRLLAQTVSVIADLLSGIRLRPESALPATDCAGRTVPGLTAKNLLLSFQQ